MDPKSVGVGILGGGVLSLRLDAVALEKLTLHCGNAVEKWQHFCAFDTSDEVEPKTGYQINVLQLSRKNSYRFNRKADSEEGVMKYIKINPEQRFMVKMYKLLPEGVHYLSTSISMDAGGKIFGITRTWAKKSIPLDVDHEKPATVFSNNPFTDRSIRNSPLRWRGFKPKENDAEMASIFLEEFSQAIQRESFGTISVDDPYCLFEPSRNNLRTSGYSR